MSRAEHPLNGPRLKVERAMDQISRLREEQTALWQDGKHQIVRSELNPKTSNYRYRASGDFSLSLGWGVAIGEIAHNLRSALDSLVYHLVLENRKTPTTTTQFPIFLVGKTTKTRPNRSRKPILIHHFEGMRRGDGRDMLRGVHRDHQATIERLQPYHRRREDGAFRTEHPLYWLKEINNTDKHRIIQVVGFRGDGVSWGSIGGLDGDRVDEVITRRPKVLKPGAIVLEASPDVVMNPRVIPLVAFAEGGVSGSRTEASSYISNGSRTPSLPSLTSSRTPSAANAPGRCLAKYVPSPEGGRGSKSGAVRR